ncbi:MAG: aspartate/glutamate racemase family protein [Alphaproteobacteria bacterium]|nr:MAG: aspartate/glutamate racemase family protein [Alphaproteobacteria bacterium]
MAAVGIVGGLGVGATVHYYKQITAACKARGLVPDLAIVHADVEYGQGLIRAGKLGELAQYLAGFIERLARAGAETAVLPAVTPHICIAELTPLLPIPLIDIVAVLAGELRRRKIRRIALWARSSPCRAACGASLPASRSSSRSPTRSPSSARPTSASSTAAARRTTPTACAASPATCSAATASRRSCWPAPTSR